MSTLPTTTMLTPETRLTRRAAVGRARSTVRANGSIIIMKNVVTERPLPV